MHLWNVVVDLGPMALASSYGLLALQTLLQAYDQTGQQQMASQDRGIFGLSLLP